MANESLIQELQRQLAGPPAPTGPSSPFQPSSSTSALTPPIGLPSSTTLPATQPRLGGILGQARGLNSVKTGPLGMLNRGGLAGGLAKGAAGFGLNIAGNVAGQALGGNTSPAGRFAQGAGLGGGLGMILGPYGALVGGLVGGLGNAIFGGGGEKTPDPNEILTTALAESGLDPQTQREVRAFYLVTSRLGNDTKEAKAAALNQAGQLILQEMQRRQEEATQAQFFGNVQEDISQFIEPFRQQALTDANLQSQIMQQLAPSLPPEYRSVITAGALGQQAASTRLANSLATTAQLSPVILAQQRQIDLVNQAAQQLVGQSISTAIGGGGGGGGLSLESLLAAQG